MQTLQKASHIAADLPRIRPFVLYHSYSSILFILYYIYTPIVPVHTIPRIWVLYVVTLSRPLPTLPTFLRRAFIAPLPSPTSPTWDTHPTLNSPGTGLGHYRACLSPSPTVFRRALISSPPSHPPPSSSVSVLSTLSADTSPYYNGSRYHQGE